MDFNEGHVSKEHREVHLSAAESVDPVSVSPIQLSSPKSPKSPGSSNVQVKGSSLSSKNNRQSYSPKDGSPKKGEIFLFYQVFCFVMMNADSF